MGTDAELGDQDRTEGHHDHEVQDVTELDASEGEQEKPFLLRGKLGLHFA